MEAKKILLIILLFFTPFFSCYFAGKSKKDHLAEGFLWGTAIAEFQNSGGDQLPHSNWAHFERQKGLFGRSPIHHHQISGKSVDHWNNIKRDVQLMKELGLTAFRFSIDWSSIEPRAGEFNQAALRHYHDLCSELVAANIVPMATLHHFTHPQWFDDLGGFEKEENIFYFKRFSQRAFKEFSEKIQLWCTINEPAVYAFCGYILGIHSPGKTMLTRGLRRAAVVLRNMLKAHTDVYRSLKDMPGGSKAKIGIVHNILKFKPRHDTCLLGEKSLTQRLTYFTNDLVMEFLSLGVFDFDVLGFLQETHIDADAPKLYDFIGLNYYATAVIGFNIRNFFGSTCFSDQVMGDMDLPVDPEGFAQALEDVAKLGVPIYVTENGMADNRDDRRPDMLKQYLDVLVKKVNEDGLDIRGYFFWTLMDNFEWDRGRSVKFGLYDERCCAKQSAYVYRDLIKEFQR